MEQDTVGPSDAIQTSQKLGAVSVFSEPTLQVALYSDVFGSQSNIVVSRWAGNARSLCTIPDELPSAPHKLVHVTLRARTQGTSCQVKVEKIDFRKPCRYRSCQDPHQEKGGWRTKNLEKTKGRDPRTQ